MAYSKSKEYIKEYNKKYRQEHSDYIKEYRQEHKEKIDLNWKKRRQENKKIRNIENIMRKKNDEIYYLATKVKVKNSLIIRYYIKVRKNNTIEKFIKKNIYYDHIGCTRLEFINHIESQFDPSFMNWDTYGDWNGKPTKPKTAWDLDHKIPLRSAKTKEDIFTLNYYKNIRPLCSFENRYAHLKDERRYSRKQIETHK